MEHLDEFTFAFIECGLWTSEDLDDSSFEDIDPEDMGTIILECKEFQKKAGDRILPDPRLAGHDFWLTRNGHGAGFWDGDWPEPFATELTKLSESFGGCEIYQGDDSNLYFQTSH